MRAKDMHLPLADSVLSSIYYGSFINERKIVVSSLQQQILKEEK